LENTKTATSNPARAANQLSRGRFLIVLAIVMPNSYERGEQLFDSDNRTTASFLAVISKP
jgi:hypothetical protein